MGDNNSSSSSSSSWLFISLCALGAAAAAVGTFVVARRYLGGGSRPRASTPPSVTASSATSNEGVKVQSSDRRVSNPPVVVAPPPTVAPIEQGRRYTESELMAVIGTWMLVIVVCIALAQFVSSNQLTVSDSRLLWALICTSSGLVIGGEPRILSRVGLSTGSEKRTPDLLENNGSRPRSPSKVAIRPLPPAVVVPSVQQGEEETKEEVEAPKPKAAPQKEEVTAAVKAIEALFEKQEYDEAFKLCQEYNQKYPASANILWRFARCHRELGNRCGDDEKPRKQELIMGGLEVARQALAADDQNPSAHKWVGIMLGLSNEFKTTKEKISSAFEIRDRFLSAVELNPSDPWAQYMMGEWCANVAALSWVERKAATMLFGEPPSTTYEDALQYYVAAENAQPGFYNMNRVCIAKAQIQLGNKAAAREWLQKALEEKIVTFDDKIAAEKARKMLEKL